MFFYLFLIKYKYILTQLLRSQSFPFVLRVLNMLILPNWLCNLSRGSGFNLNVNYYITSLRMCCTMRQSYQKDKQMISFDTINEEHFLCVLHQKLFDIHTVEYID
jgi:hypothetical protein